MPARAGRAPAFPKPVKSTADARRILARLATQHPNADTELNFSTPYELLVATILSAQCTDERVNQVTPALFRRYPDARALARATTAELEPQIQSTGFFRSKSKALVGMAKALAERHSGDVPSRMEDLVELPGVGRKTANVVLGHALGVPGLPVDRHVLRVSNRIGIARSEDPEVVEQQLCAATPPSEWTRTSDTLILHGRRICKPRPLCDRCAVRADCVYYRRVIAPAAVRVAKQNRPESRGESSRTPKHGRAPHGRGTGPGIEAPQSRGESSQTPKHGRAPQGRGTGQGIEAPQSRGESSQTPKHGRAPQGRGTGRGGGAPRQIKE